MKYENIKTFEDACKALNLDPATAVPDFSALPPHHHAALQAHTKLIVIAEALNLDEEGKPYRPNWNDIYQAKYFPWYEVEASEEKPSGFGFSFTYCDYSYSFSFTCVGSRLCYRTREIALYAAKQFKELYQAYFLFNE